MASKLMMSAQKKIFIDYFVDIECIQGRCPRLLQSLQIPQQEVIYELQQLKVILVGENT